MRAKQCASLPWTRAFAPSWKWLSHDRLKANAGTQCLAGAQGFPAPKCGRLCPPPVSVEPFKEQQGFVIFTGRTQSIGHPIYGSHIVWIGCEVLPQITDCLIIVMGPHKLSPLHQRNPKNTLPAAS
jgi:hypothetical protein